MFDASHCFEGSSNFTCGKIVAHYSKFGIRVISSRCEKFFLARHHLFAHATSKLWWLLVVFSKVPRGYEPKEVDTLFVAPDGSVYEHPVEGVDVGVWVVYVCFVLKSDSSCLFTRRSTSSSNLHSGT